MKFKMKCLAMLVMGCGLMGCVQNFRNGQKITGKFIAPSDSLRRTKFSSLGISIELPQNVKEVQVRTNSDYQNYWGCSVVEFRLMTLSFGRLDIESGPMIWGEVRVYDSKQEQIFQNAKFNDQGYKAYVGLDNRRITKYDKVVKLNTPLKNRFGYTQKIYRIDRRNKENGHVFRASIVRALYAESLKRDQSDERLVTNILESIRFEKIPRYSRYVPDWFYWF